MAIDLKKHGPYALITGAALGIGEAFANQLAQKGFSLVLVARNHQKLMSIASRLSSTYRIDVKVVALDLMQEHAAGQLVAETNQLEIGLVVLNAGIYGLGAFLENTLEYERNLMQLNMVSPMQLAHHFGREMVQRQRGGNPVSWFIRRLSGNALQRKLRRLEGICASPGRGFELRA